MTVVTCMILRDLITPDDPHPTAYNSWTSLPLRLSMLHGPWWPLADWLAILRLPSLRTNNYSYSREITHSGPASSACFHYIIILRVSIMFWLTAFRYEAQTGWGRGRTLTLSTPWSRFYSQSTRHFSSEQLGFKVSVNKYVGLLFLNFVNWSCMWRWKIVSHV
jgi:hypothetical protein